MTKSNSELDALIVGAGPTGLVLATQLQCFGTRFRIIDRLRDRTRESRALAVQARTLELLQMLGLGERLVARGNRSTRLKWHLEGRAVAAVTLGDFSAVDTRFPALHRNV
jgi:2-polyprenyl-6-methoxyphenol hydroxylase-like FAD-dependent oxidoreductase